MQNQTNTQYSSNLKGIFKSAKIFLEKLNPRGESSKTTISKVLSKILSRHKTSSNNTFFARV